MANKYTEKCMEFPGGPVVKNQSVQCRHMDSIPGRGTKILYAMAHGQINKSFKKDTRCHMSSGKC